MTAQTKVSPGAPAQQTAKPLNADLPLPHERDQAPDPGDTGGPDSPGPRQITEQAARDIARGLCDTERRGVPSDVPGPKPPAERSPGAEVPPQGVQRTNYGDNQR